MEESFAVTDGNNDNNDKCINKTACMNSIVVEIADIETIQMENMQLKELNTTQAKRIEELETRLKKYTNGDNHKRYYEKNKNKIKETGTAYLQKLKAENPDKLKEYSHNAYLRKKLKKQLEEEEKNTYKCGETVLSL